MKNISADFLKDITQKLCQVLPNDLQILKKDLEKNVNSILQSAFAKLELVTHEEFLAQTKVLARNRKRVEELEKKIATLEVLIEKKNASL